MSHTSRPWDFPWSKEQSPKGIRLPVQNRAGNKTWVSTSHSRHSYHSASPICLSMSFLNAPKAIAANNERFTSFQYIFDPTWQHLARISSFHVSHNRSQHITTCHDLSPRDCTISGTMGLSAWSEFIMPSSHVCESDVMPVKPAKSQSEKSKWKGKQNFSNRPELFPLCWALWGVRSVSGNLGKNSLTEFEGLE